jgi:hypothetical protein
MLNRAKLICTSLHNAFGVPRQNFYIHYFTIIGTASTPAPALHGEKLVNLSAAPGAA